jgi:hypothetical protein
MKPIWEYSIEHWPVIFIITLIIGVITQNLIIPAIIRRVKRKNKPRK